MNDKSRGLDLVVTRSSEAVAEVECKGGGGYRYVVNLETRTCTCREWQVSGKPCSHAISFTTYLRGASLETYVHDYFTVERFRVAYHQLIHALPVMSQWPNSDHEFFLHPPILRKTAGMPRKGRYKGCTDKGSKVRGVTKGEHRCPICKGYGHH